MTLVLLDSKSQLEVVRIAEDINFTWHNTGWSKIRLSLPNGVSTWWIDGVEYDLEPMGGDEEEEHVFYQAHLYTYLNIRPDNELAKSISDKLWKKAYPEEEEKL